MQERAFVAQRQSTSFVQFINTQMNWGSGVQIPPEAYGTKEEISLCYASLCVSRRSPVRVRLVGFFFKVYNVLMHDEEKCMDECKQKAYIQVFYKKEWLFDKKE